MDDLDGGGHIVIIYPGTYTGGDVAASGFSYQLSSNGTNVTVRGPIPGDYDYSRTGGNVVLDGSSCLDHFVSISHSGWTLQNITIQNAVASGKYGLYNTTAALTTIDLKIKNCNRGALILSGGNHDRLKIEETPGTYTLAITGNGSSVFNYPIFSANDGYITFLGNSTLTFNNPVFTGFYRRVIDPESARTGTFTFNNAIFSGNTLDSTDQFIVNLRGAGTWSFNNTIGADRAIQKNAFFTSTAGASLTDGRLSNIQSPMWLSNRRAGNTKIFLHIDDSENYAAFYSLADLVMTHGWKAGWAISYYGSASVNFQKVARYINLGHEVMGHARSGTRLSTTSAFNATKAGSTIVVSVARPDANDSSSWTGTLTLDAETPIDLASASYDTMNEVVAYLTGKGVTVAQATGQVSFAAADVGANFAKSLMLSSGTYNINTTQTLIFHETSLYVAEILEPKAWLQASVRAVVQDDLGETVDMSSWSPLSFVWPGGLSSANSISYVIDTAGYNQARAAGLDTGTYRLQAMNLGKVGALLLNTDLGSTTGTDTNASIQAETKGFIDALLEQGGIGGIFTHTYVSADWAAVISALASYGSKISIENFSDIMDWVRSNDDHVTSHVSYRCYTETASCFPDKSNYRPQSIVSPCVNAGTNVGLTTDFDGRSVPGMGHANPCIGAYEFYGGGSGGSGCGLNMTMKM